ncbi:CHASE2 domain-containing protein [Mastigocoleus testarum]|uniref:Histidine kinase n=1 Tax=Mastigocoleus testarum BC008 TaxID=371196 RepID=A0A0V7ZIH5_9CYAN|nr:CHASE2 domain-containing protein [Mastigocoleus testarum]KST63856.1 histidine kinase [Mastigocoleus testarum BC008]KST64191.1 histidine kinase [Mastigocoleus testarum BC008]
MINVYLKIQKVDRTCLFELSWGKGQQLNAQITYPESIASSYQEWQRFYRKFYSNKLRGKVINQGVVAPPSTDWQAKLVQAEAKLLYEFHQWLRSSNLYDIRSKISTLSKELEEQKSKDINSVCGLITNIFISCNDLELAHLPWEAWEIGTEFAADKIRVIRQPINIIQATSERIVRRKARVLTILGDDTNLNFQEEKKALKSLNKIVDVEFVGWKVGTDIDELKQEIISALNSDKGWDILFFAGHSNETYLTGGEIAIAPNTSLYLSELEKHLTTAKEKGLQVAIFNSCSGLSIANKLIDLGISQVAIMREPIHNQVATDFLVKFSQALAEYKDVHECLLAASQYLKVEKNLTYPSSYLVPSLFRHPAAPLFRIEPFQFKQRLKSLIPTPLEAVTISALVLISLQLPVQGWLLERRVLAQAIYRNLTGQINSVTTPPVLLVQIDNESIKKARIFNPRPMDRKYLASLIDKLVELKAPVIGIDYLLDRPNRNSDRILANSIKAGLNSRSQTTKSQLTRSQPTWFVFPKTRDPNGTWLSVHEEIASYNWSLPGEIEVLPGYMQLLPSSDDNPKPRPLGFVLALSHQLQKSPNSPQPRLESKQDFWEQISVRSKTARTVHIKTNGNNRKYSNLKISNLISAKIRLQPLTANSYHLGQMWLHPIIDFSIPPNQIYQTISAWELLENSSFTKFQKQLSQQIVIIAPGAYGEAGIAQNNEDNFDLPAALGYWRNQIDQNNTRGVLTGGEIHGYMTHHYLKNRIVVPIPDLWTIGLAIILGKFTSDYLIKNLEQRQQNLILISIASTIYALISLQLYISPAAIILPWLLPTITFWFYVLHAFYQKKADL